MKYVYFFFFILFFHNGFTQKIECANNRKETENIFDKILLVVNEYRKNSEISNTLIEVEIDAQSSDSLRFVVTQSNNYVSFLEKRPSCYFLNEDYMICVYFQNEIAHNDTTWLQQLVENSKAVLKCTGIKILSWEKRTYTIKEPVVVVYDPPIIEYAIVEDNIIKIKNRITPLFENAFVIEYLKYENHDRF